MCTPRRGAIDASRQVASGARGGKEEGRGACGVISASSVSVNTAVGCELIIALCWQTNMAQWDVPPCWPVQLGEAPGSRLEIEKVLVATLYLGSSLTLWFLFFLYLFFLSSIS